MAFQEEDEYEEDDGEDWVAAAATANIHPCRPSYQVKQAYDIPVTTV